MSRRHSPGEGSLQRSQARRIPVSFDDETFGQVRALALMARVSFAEQIRQLVEFGLEAVQISETKGVPGAEPARAKKR